MFRNLRVLCFAIPFVFAAIVGVNTQTTFAQHQNKPVTPTATPSNPYPGLESPNSDIIIGNEVMVGGIGVMSFAYAPIRIHGLQPIG